ncbi:hypothetical protein MHYP_G00309120 [Metynnis hypsauchen]
MKLIRVQYENILAIDSIVKKEESEGGQWTLEEIMTEFEDVFTEDGCLQGEYVIEIDKTVEPVKLPKCRVPVAMMKPLKEELAGVERRQIIAPVECSTDWISSMVAVQKPSGKLRICIDPKPLNRALKRSHFPLPTIDDILPDLSNTKVFTACDVKQGFWHVKLEEESSYLTTFSTPFGRFRWLRMPMSISPAPEIFQRKLMQALEGLPGIYIIADDVLITGEGETVENATKDHDEKLRHFLNRCREQNIKLNADKFKLKKENKVPYIGHLLTSEGLKIDPEKVRAVTEMPRPTDVKGVQRLVGMVNYLSKFYAHLSDDSEILRQLTHKDSIWDWTLMHEEAFVRLKTNIAKTPVLKYYSPEEELTLQCDASETGLGAALTQNGKPVAFTSRALTSTERGYAQIEKECLAKFHQYTYGRQVTVQSDHKPLENIVKKPLLSAPKRLQRMLLRLQKYSIQVTYVPGRDMLLADTLGRAYLPESTTGPVEAEIETVNMAQYLPISTERLKVIRSATETDVKLQKLIQVIQSGWPANKKNILPEVAHYYNLQDELTYQDGIIFRGERALIPDTLREDIMHRIHSSHLGVEGCLRQARECVYWPGMNEHIKIYIAKCDTCRAMDIRQQKETLHPHEVQTRPWAKVGADLFVFENKDYLETVDYYSNFWEVDYLQDTTSSMVIRKLKAHFARYGIPDVVCSDNGPQYTSQEFRQFSQRWEFEHRTLSPGYPQSNGKAESAVKMAKRIVKKAKASGRDPYLAILDHRNTPNQGLNTSPVQRLFSRRTRTLLPITRQSSKARDTTEHTRTEKQPAQIKYYNRTAKDLQPLKQGDRWTREKENRMKRVTLVVLYVDGVVGFGSKPRSNVVLLGRENEEKTSVSKLLLGKKFLTSHQKVKQKSSSVCVRREGEVCGRLIGLVEMLALYNAQLSEDEVMQEAFHCVSVCDPGVHAFFIVISEGRFTDEDKGEMEMIQRIFSSRFNKSTIVLISWQSQSKELDASVKKVIKAFGRRYKFLDSKTDATQLIKCLELLHKESRGSLYTMDMYIDAQVETQLQYKKHIQSLQHKITDLIRKNRSQGKIYFS